MHNILNYISIFAATIGRFAHLYDPIAALLFVICCYTLASITGNFFNFD